MPPLELGAVRRRRARHQRGGLLLDPPERRDVLVGAEQDPGLARAGLRGEIGLPFGKAVGAVGHPARHVRGIAVTHRAAQDRQREPVDLEVDDPGDVGSGDDPLPARDPLRNADRIRVVRAQEHREYQAHGRDRERGQQRPPEVLDREHAVGHFGSDHEDERVRDEHEQEAENQRERQPQGRHDGWDDRVEGGDDHRDHERTPEALDPDPGQEARDHQQGHAHRQPRDQQTEQPPAGTAGRPGRIGVAGHPGSPSVQSCG